VKRLWFGDFGTGSDAEIDVNAYEHLYYRGIKSPTTKLLPKCDCCPCVESWYIVGLCWCDVANCDFETKCRIGWPAYLTGHDPTTTPPCLPQDVIPVTDCDGVSVRKFTMWKHDAWVDKAGNNDTFFCFDANLGCVIQAIEHEVTVPVECAQIWATLYIDGEFKQNWEFSAGYTLGQVLKIGNDYFADDNADEYRVPLLKVLLGEQACDYGYEFDSVGDHTVDLIVRFLDGNDQALNKDGCRSIVRIYDSHTPEIEGLEALTHPYVGDVFIVPRRMLQSLGITSVGGEIDTSCTWFGPNGWVFYGHIMKGPFDTREDAEYVCAEEEVNGENWRSLMQRWANYCQCSECGQCHGEACVSHMNFSGYINMIDWEYYDNSSGSFTIVPPSCQDTAIISFSLGIMLDFNSGQLTVEVVAGHFTNDGFVVEHTYASETWVPEDPWSKSISLIDLITKPCEKLYIRMKTAGETNVDLFDAYCDYGRYPFNYPEGPNYIDCAENEADFGNIPNNSDDVRAHQSQLSMLKEMPEGMA